MTLEALKNIQFSDLKLNLDMSNILSEYPQSCVPRKLQPRTGKAKTVYTRKLMRISMKMGPK